MFQKKTIHPHHFCRRSQRSRVSKLALFFCLLLSLFCQNPLLAMQSAPAGITIQGHVLNKATAKPVPKATVALYFRTGLSRTRLSCITTSDLNGAYSIIVNSSGLATITASCPQYRSSSIYQYLFSGTKLTLDFQLEPIIDTTPPSGSIRMNNGSQYTNLLSVTLNLLAQDNLGGSGLSQMQFSNDGLNWSNPEKYATAKAWSLTTGHGVKTVYVRFFDQAGNSSQVYSAIINLQSQPKLSPFPLGDNVTIDAGKELQFTLSASDPDGDSLSYSVTSLPEGAVFDNGKFSWTPNSNQAGVYQLNFSVSDGLVSDKAALSITVNQLFYQASVIQAVIDNAKAGDVVYINPGIYQGGISLKEGISLVALDPLQTVIVNSNYANKGTIIAAKNTQISGFTIKGRTNGIYCSAEDKGIGDLLIANCIIVDVNGSGVYAEKLGLLVLKNNLIFRCAYSGLDVRSCMQVDIQNNTIDGNGDNGIYYALSDSGRIINNIITNNRSFGVYQLGGTKPVILNNDFWNNSKGFCYGYSQFDPTNISSDPLFVDPQNNSYYLSQTESGQPETSPCVDIANDTAYNLGLGYKTTSSRFTFDEGQGDLGFHYYGPHINHAPIVGDPLDINASVNKYTGFNIAAVDVDGDILTYHVDPLPQGAVMDSQKGIFSWKPVADQIGVYSLNISVSDGRETVNKQIMINVNSSSITTLGFSAPWLPWSINLHPEDIGLFNNSVNKFEIQKACDYIKDLGAGMIRIDFSWKDLEPSVPTGTGTYFWDEAKFTNYRDFVTTANDENGLKIIAVLSRAPDWAVNLYKTDPEQYWKCWTDFCSRIAYSFGDKVKYYQLGNEPNGGPPFFAYDFIKDEDDYLTAYYGKYGLESYDKDESFKTMVNINCNWIGWEDWLTKYMINAKDYIDIVGIDHYPGTNSVAFFDDWGPLVSLLKRINDPSDPCYGKQGAVMETGYSTWAWGSESTQSEWINKVLPAVKNILINNSSKPYGIVFANFYELFDEDYNKSLWPPEAHFGILYGASHPWPESLLAKPSDSGKAKPAYLVLQDWIKNFYTDTPPTPPVPPAPPIPPPTPPGAVEVPFETLVLSQNTPGGTRYPPFESLWGIEDEALWKRCWGYISSAEDPLPLVDFSKEFVVGIFLPQCPNSGYSVTITDIQKLGDRLILYIKKTKPEPGGIYSQVLTYPRHLVKCKGRAPIYFNRVDY